MWVFLFAYVEVISYICDMKKLYGFLNILIIIFEIVLLGYFSDLLYADWDKNPLTRDYFSLLIIGEIGLELYLRVKSKTKNLN